MKAGLLALGLIAVVASGIALAKSVEVTESQFVPRPAEPGRNIPGTVWFQGYLANSATGDPITGSYTIVARIYDAPAAGGLLWGPETHAGVSVTNGWFNIELGATVQMDLDFDGDSYYLQLHVGGEALSPRMKVGSMPAAFHAAEADSFVLPFWAGSMSPVADMFTLHSYNDGDWDTFEGHRSGGDHYGSVTFMGYNESASPVFAGWSNGASAAYMTVDASDTARAVHAYVPGSSTNGNAVAVYGESPAVSDDGWSYGGVGGQFVGGGLGVWGHGNGNDTRQAFGVYGEVSGGSGVSTNYGVYGTASGGATNWAGYFSGDVRVTGTINPTLARFTIDHPLDPENQYLSHAYVASSDAKDVYDGVAMLDGSGRAWVELPDWFEALNGDFRYQLTCVGAFAPVYIAEEISGNRFLIAGGDPGTKVCWQVTGIRKDAYAQANRSSLETSKTGYEQGRYANAAAFGQPESKEIGSELRQASEKLLDAGRKASIKGQRAGDED